MEAEVEEIEDSQSYTELKPYPTGPNRMSGINAKLEILQDFNEIAEDDLTEEEELSTMQTSRISREANKEINGLNTKLEILQDFNQISEEDLTDEEVEELNTSKTSRISQEVGKETIIDNDNEIQLPIKLPPDLTIVKEVVPIGTSTPMPTPAKRGRPRKTPVALSTTIVSQDKVVPIAKVAHQEIPLPKRGRPPKRKTPIVLDLPVVEKVTPSPKGKRGRPRKVVAVTPVVAMKSAPMAKRKTPTIVLKNVPSIITTSAGSEYPCSMCPRVFSSEFGRTIHENACCRNSDAPTPTREPEEILPDLTDPPFEDVIVKPKKRGRPPKVREPVIELYNCEICSRTFNTVAGCRRHEASCRRKDGTAAGDEPNVPIYNKQLNRSQAQVTAASGDQSTEEEMDVKDPYVFEEGRCHCCGEDIETAHLGGEFECVECQKQFRLKSSLERHRRVIHNEGETYQCPECDARCPDKGTLARHMYTHTGLKPVSCPVCKVEFSRKYHLIRHNYQTGCDGSKKPTFPCQVCGRVFNRKDNLREHLRAHAGQTKRKKRYTCKECKKEYLGLSALNVHMRTHNPNLLDGDKPFGCDHCSKSFPSNSALLKHKRKHTGERPFECTFCFARFAAKETLNRHLRTHTGVKPHTCQYCGKGFIQASQLRAHIFHHSGEGGFNCETCGKSFNRRQRLVLHVKYVHEGAEPYKCGDCDRTFLRKEDVARHQLLHSGLKEHKCPICEKAFAMKSSLKIHLLTHTKEPPRSCDECGRAFIRQDCLLRHMRTKHRDMLEEIMAEAEKKKLQQQLLAAANQAALQVPSEEPHVLTEATLAESVRELLTLLVDETTLKAFGWPDSSVDKLLEAVIRRCGHQPAGFEDMAYSDRLRENAKLLFTVVIDDTAVKTLLNNQTVDEVILHVLRLAKS